MSNQLTISIPPKAVLEPGSPASSEGTLGGTEINEKCHPKQMEVLDLDSPTVDSLNEKTPHNVDLEAQTHAQRKPKIFASARYTLLTLYRRLFTIVFFVNVAVFITVMVNQKEMLLALVNATAANLLVCGLARQPLVVNAIFKVVCSMPRSSPLILRRIAAKVYHYGGVHSGCGVASLIWYVGFVGVLSHQYWSSTDSQIMSAAPLVLSYTILVLLLAIIVVAHPAVRMKRHDYFELTHRFSGWLVVALFFALLMVVSHEASQSQQQPLGKFLISLPAFWFLLITIIAIIQPWLFLRKVAVRTEALSTHATRLHFDHAITTFGKGIQLAKHPLRDWHGFATFPDPTPSGPSPNSVPSFSCLISKAGDWTSETIQSPPTHMWKRGVLIYGFAYAMRVFRRVIVVTTGSGIGPCLSFLGDENRPALRVLWQTRAPHRTYGEGVLDLVRRMDSDPIVLDTDQCGRVDMIPIILQQIKDFDAEAVCVISNPVLTGRIVYELEARGTPAFGPIFDS